MKGEDDMTELNLEAIKARYKAATPGPWYPSTNFYSSVPTTIVYKDLNQRRQTLAYGFLSDADQEFIASAREDVPMLVAEVERLYTASMKESDKVLELLRRIIDCEKSKVYPE